MLYLRREAESGCVYGSRNFSKPKGAILFYLNKLLKKKRKEKRGRKKQSYLVKLLLILKKKKTSKRAKSKVEHVRGILEFHF